MQKIQRFLPKNTTKILLLLTCALKLSWKTLQDAEIVLKFSNNCAETIVKKFARCKSCFELLTNVQKYAVKCFVD